MDIIVGAESHSLRLSKTLKGLRSLFFIYGVSCSDFTPVVPRPTLPPMSEELNEQLDFTQDNTDVPFKGFPVIYELKRQSRFEIFSIEMSAIKDMVRQVSNIRLKFTDRGEPYFDKFAITFLSVVSPSVEQCITTIVKDKPEGISFVINEFGPCGEVVQKWTVTDAKIIDVDFGYLDAHSNEEKLVQVWFNPLQIHLEY